MIASIICGQERFGPQPTNSETECGKNRPHRTLFGTFHRGKLLQYFEIAVVKLRNQHLEMSFRVIHQCILRGDNTVQNCKVGNSVFHANLLTKKRIALLLFLKEQIALFVLFVQSDSLSSFKKERFTFFFKIKAKPKSVLCPTLKKRKSLFC